MSVSAQLWRIASAARVAESERAPALASEPLVDGGAYDPLTALVRGVFFQVTPNQARNVLFLAADQDTRVVELCERAAVTLTNLSGSRAAVVAGPLMSASAKRPPQRVAEASLWRAHSVALNDRVWRLPSWLFCDRLAQDSSEQRRPTAEFRSVFKYFLFATSAGSDELPTFSGICDAAVLVVTANRTRRDVAVQAKEQLARYKVPLLGTVLNGRVYEIPDALYRRL